MLLFGPASDMRSAEYDGDPYVAVELLDDEALLSDIIGQVYAAIDTATRSGASVLNLCFGNLMDGDETYPAERAVNYLRAIQELEPIGDCCYQTDDVVTCFLDRQDYCNYYVEDFVPFLLVISDLLQEDGYRLEESGNGIGARLILRIKNALSDGRTVEFYEDVLMLTSSVDGAEIPLYSARVRVLL